MMRSTSTRARWAALTSGALVAGGLVVAPAVAGLSAATAAPVTLGYTCTVVGGGQTIPQDSTISLDVTVPASVAPGASVPTSVAAVIDMGKAAFGPITDLSGTFTIPLTVGGATTDFVLPSSSAPVSALKFSGTATGNLTAPDAAGSAPITVGTVVGNLKTTPFGVDTVTTCVPDAGQDQTVGQLTVADEPAPAGLGYTCVITGGPTPLNLDSTVTVDISHPETVAGGDALVADLAVEVDMGTVMLGPVDGAEGELDIDMLVGDQASTVSIPVEPVTMTPSTPGPLVLQGAGQVELGTPLDEGTVDIAIGDILADLQVSVFGTKMANQIPCTPDEGQDQTVSSVDIEEAAPVAVPVTGAVKISGTAKVGKTLKAVPGKASGATVTYQWLANGKAIKNAKKPSLKLTKAMGGKKVSVRATYAKDGFLDTVQTSKAVTVKKAKK